MKDPGKKRKRGFGRRARSEMLWGWGFVLPTLTGLIILNIIPIFQTIYQSFFKTGAFGRGNVFIGLDNYKALLEDDNVWQAVINTFKYMIVEVPVSMVIALGLAVLLNKKIKFRSMFRTIFFLPMIVASAAVAMVWRWLYNSDFGLINHIIGKNINWISSGNTAIYAIAVIGIWSIIGYNMVLFLASLQEVPRDFYEAASLDGASGFQKFLHITVPMISPTIYFVAVTRIISALQVFDLIYMVMDNTNPALYKTQSLVYLFYKESFINGNKGYGSAIVVLLLVIIMVITVFQNFAQKKWVHYE